MPIEWRLNKHTVVCSGNVVLYQVWTTGICNNTDDSSKYYGKWKAKNNTVYAIWLNFYKDQDQVLLKETPREQAKLSIVTEE